MTTPTGREPENMHAMLLRFIGSFSRLQDLIDDVVIKIFFQRRMPVTGEIFWKRAVYRIKDDERVDLVLAIAKEVDTDAELDCFRAVFNRVKRLRDNVAHSARITAQGDDRLVIVRTVIGSATAPEPAPTDVERSQLSDAIRDCDWLSAQAQYILSSKQLLKEIRLGSILMETFKPSRVPEDWDGVVMRGVDANVEIDTN